MHSDTDHKLSHQLVGTPCLHTFFLSRFWDALRTLLENKVGFPAYLKLPTWKNEGYCEMVADEEFYDRVAGLNHICNESEPSNPSFHYFKYKMAVEHLLTTRKMPLQTFLDSPYFFEEVTGGAKKAYCEESIVIVP